VPAVISGDLIDMYNTGFAKANDLPQLTPEILRDRNATLVLGSSSFNPRAGTDVRSLPVRLIGVSDRVPLVGISVPLEVVNRWNAELAGEGSPEYVQLTVVAGRAEEVDRVAGQIEAMGYTVTTGREIAERVRTLTDVLRAAFGTIGLVVLIVAGIGIGNALLLSVMERRHEIGIFRSVGASRGDIRLLFLVEAALIGLLGAVTGVTLAVLAARVADLLLDRVLPDLPLLPPSFFALSWPILLAGLTLGVLVSVLAAVPPAHRAARLDPARTLETG
jgi:ABC-type antimicrobial peptide transport system permease subunit